VNPPLLMTRAVGFFPGSDYRRNLGGDQENRKRKCVDTKAAPKKKKGKSQTNRKGTTYLESQVSHNDQDSRKSEKKGGRTTRVPKAGHPGDEG